MSTKTWLLVAGTAATMIAGGSGIAFATSAAPSGSAAGHRAPAKEEPAEPNDPDAGQTFFTEVRIGLLASELGISGEQAHRVGHELEALAVKGGDSLSPADPAFIAIAASVGKTARELAAAVDTLKKMG
jgi:hypothetical protein